MRPAGCERAELSRLTGAVPSTVVDPARGETEQMLTGPSAGGTLDADGVADAITDPSRRHPELDRLPRQQLHQRRLRNNRTTRAQQFTWNADGTPNFGAPVALGTSLAEPSGETATTPTAYTLVNKHSGKCLDVAKAGTLDGADVIQWSCNGGSNQKWTFSDPGNETAAAGC
jgi:hypothetical protein